jgi:hypothetical protein
VDKLISKKAMLAACFRGTECGGADDARYGSRQGAIISPRAMIFVWQTIILFSLAGYAAASLSQTAVGRSDHGCVAGIFLQLEKNVFMQVSLPASVPKSASLWAYVIQAAEDKKHSGGMFKIPAGMKVNVDTEVKVEAGPELPRRGLFVSRTSSRIVEVIAESQCIQYSPERVYRVKQDE